MANNVVSEKKKALLARKEKLLQDIQYYERRIADFHANKKATSFYEDNCSSDSDGDFPIIDNGPSVTQLKLQQSHLKTSLQATQELTNLHLLEHEVNIMVTDPDIVDEPQVTEPGIWKEVIAECRLDLVPFMVTFHVHRPSMKFGAPSYRNLKVMLTKPAHETELANSVLTHTTTPSDAIEVLRSYSAAHRSRRTTLARLAEKYPNLLFMEPLTEGGYILKCAGLLEVCWTLQNKWSPIAPFHHRMKFDLEYMDESYIKIITNYHRQLSDPSLETDERTALLSKIINTCLEAKGPTQELYESMESDDPETAQTLRQRRMTLDQEVTETAPKRKRDDGIMAPPKSLPKKSKAKGKENKVQSNDNVKVKSNADKDVTNASGTDSVVSGKSKDSKKDATVAKCTKESDNSRKENAKLTQEVADRNESEKAAKEMSDIGEENVKSTKKVSNNVKGNVKPTKEIPNKKDGVAKSKENTEVRNSVVKSTKGVSDGTKSHRNVKDGNNLKDGARNIKTVHEDDNSKDTNVTSIKATKNVEDSNKNSAKVSKKSIVPNAKDNVNEEPNKKGHKDKGETQNEKINSDKGSATKAKVVAKNTEKSNKINDKIERSVPKKVKKTDNIADIPAKKAKIDQTTKNTDSNVKNTEKSTKSIANTNKQPKNLQKNNTKDQNNAKTKDDAEKRDSTYTKSSETIEKVTDNKNQIMTNKPNLVEHTDNPKNSAKNIESASKIPNTNPKIPKKSTAKHDKVKNIEQNVKNNIQNAKKSIINVQDKMKSVKNIGINKNVHRLSQKFKVSNGNTKVMKKPSAGNTVKETSTDSKSSKIPQSLTKVPSSLKNNPLRISPRKLSSNWKSAANAKKTIQKQITSIPRLLKKPVVKT